MIKLRTKLVVDNKTIAASGSYTSAPVAVSRAESGVFSIHYRLQGAGTAKFEYLLASNLTGLTNRLNPALAPPVIFLEPSGVSDIASTITVASGPALHRAKSRAFTSGSVDPIVGETFTGASNGKTAIYEGRNAVQSGTFSANTSAYFPRPRSSNQRPVSSAFRFALLSNRRISEIPIAFKRQGREVGAILWRPPSPRLPSDRPRS